MRHIDQNGRVLGSPSSFPSTFERPQWAATQTPLGYAQPRGESASPRLMQRSLFSDGLWSPLLPPLLKCSSVLTDGTPW